MAHKLTDPAAPAAEPIAFDQFLAVDIRVGTVVAVEPFPEAPRQIGPFMSEVLTVGFADAQGAIVLIRPDKEVPNGARLF